MASAIASYGLKSSIWLAGFQAPVDCILVDHVIAIGVIVADASLLGNAVGIIEHDVVRYPDVVRRLTSVIKVAAAHDNPVLGSEHGIIFYSDVICIVPEMNRRRANLIDEVVHDGARSGDVYALNIPAALMTDVMNNIVHDVRSDPAVVMIAIDRRTAVRGATGLASNMVDVIVLDDVIRTTIVDTGEPGYPTLLRRICRVDFESIDLDIAAPVIPCGVIF